MSINLLYLELQGDYDTMKKSVESYVVYLITPHLSLQFLASGEWYENIDPLKSTPSSRRVYELL
jgi:hypothetical protein